ncbi:MAG: hypothetical protein ACI9U0_002304 [Flavobacteriales bacterium]|jgi:hypothetical protein
MKILNTLLISLLAYSASAQVGIGTSTPSGALDIETTETSQTSLDINNTSSGDPSINLQVSGDTKFTVGIDNSDSDKLKIGTDSTFATTPAITIDASQNVGIGNTSPTATLDVDGSAIFNETGNPVDFRVEGDAQTHLLFVDGSSDYIGIGNSAPDARLHVVSHDATNSAIVDVLKLSHTTLGTPSTGIGTGLVFMIEDGGDHEAQASINVELDDVTNGSEDATMTFDINQGGTMTEVMRIDGTAGYVGIGTTTPSEILDIVGNAEINGDIYMDAATTETRRFVVGDGRTGDGISRVDLIGDATYTAFGLRLTRGGGVNAQSHLWHRGTGDFYIYAQEAADLKFVNNNSTNMVLTSAGFLGIGTTSPGVELEVAGDIHATNGTSEVYLNDAGRIEITTNSGSGYIDFKDNIADDYDVRIVETTDGLQIATGGNGTASTAFYLKSNQTLQLPGYGAGTLTTDAGGNITASSDERLKNISGEFTRGLSDIKNITPITYKWKSSTGNDSINDYSGFSAQNIQANIPEAIGEDPKGFLTLSDRPILATLVNAINEQQDIIEAQKQEIERLKNEAKTQKSETETIKAEASSAKIISTETAQKLAALEAKLNALLLLNSNGAVLTAEN